MTNVRVRIPAPSAKKDDAGESTLRKVFGAEFDAMLERVAQKVVKDITKKMLEDEDLLYEIALSAMRAIPYEKVRGPQGPKGDQGEKGERGERGEMGPQGSGITDEQINALYEGLLERAVKNGVGSGKDIVEKINGLEIEPDLQIDAKHIKNLPKADPREGTPLHRGGVKLVWNTELEGTINGVNTIFTLPASLPDPKDNRMIISIRGVMKSVESGDFTLSNNNRTVTFASAPPNGSARPRVHLYHGK